MGLEVQLNNQQNEVELDFNFLKEVARIAVKSVSKNIAGELSIALLRKEKMKELNKSLRKKDYYPDVLSYTLEEKPFIGEVFLSPLIALNQGKQYGNDIKHEMSLLLIHGILHLFNFDDGSLLKRNQMREKEKEILNHYFKKGTEK
ncbi:MAG: rRNA maturation RNase YbeY [Actinomycetia bacterium]|nr:rRNA maturation RNase YbeY [Actinomycetes bacterium]